MENSKSSEFPETGYLRCHTDLIINNYLMVKANNYYLKN